MNCISVYVQNEVYQNAFTQACIPITVVSSGISSIKHFLSVSAMWKYNPEHMGSNSTIYPVKILSNFNILKTKSVHQNTNTIHTRHSPEINSYVIVFSSINSSKKKIKIKTVIIKKNLNYRQIYRTQYYIILNYVVPSQISSWLGLYIDHCSQHAQQVSAGVEH